MSIEVVALLVTVFIAVVGWATVFGVCKQKIENNADEIKEVKESLERIQKDLQKDIDEVKADSKEQSVILQSINNNLAALNSNFNLLINGQLKIKGVTE